MQITHPNFVSGFAAGTPVPVPTAESTLARSLLVAGGPQSSVVEAICRGESVDPTDIQNALGVAIGNLQRGITTGMTAFPVREHLESEAISLVPVSTPLRNRLPRTSEMGLAVAWRQITSLGGGWASGDQPGHGGGAAQVFYPESGAPAELTSVYAARSSAFKLMGQRGSVTGLAMAAGANFMNQYAREKVNALTNLMLIEENALINADASGTAAPWGDGTTAYAYDGLLVSIKTGNGTPSSHIQTTVGALTTAHIDAQITRIWKQGGRGLYMIMNAQEAQSLTNLMKAEGSLIRTMSTGKNNRVAAGLFVDTYVHPISGENVEIVVSKFLPAGTIIFAADTNDQGQPAAEVGVLPQVQLPELAVNQQVQGYVLQEIAPAWATPQVYGFLISLFSVFKPKAMTLFAKSTGVTAV